jgi:hypothetical protein
MNVPILRSSGARVVALIACLVVAAVQVDAQRFKAGFYSFVPPVGWQRATENVSKGMVAFMGPRELNFGVNINILSEPAPHETMAQYVTASHKLVEAHKEIGMKILKDGAKVMAGGPVHTVIAELQMPNRPDIPMLRNYQVYALHKDRAFILTLTYPKDVPQSSAKKYIDAFDKLVASFKWEK